MIGSSITTRFEKVTTSLPNNFLTENKIFMYFLVSSNVEFSGIFT